MTSSSSSPSFTPRSYAPTPARRVAFLGLGVMGYPMAAHLAKAGHTVTVYNRSPAKAAAWLAEANVSRWLAPGSPTKARMSTRPGATTLPAQLMMCEP